MAIESITRGYVVVYKSRVRTDKQSTRILYMINTKHLLKVVSVWTSVVYAICYAGVALYPQSRMLFMRYSLHADVPFTSGFFGIGYFISGLIIWNVAAVLAAWFFAYLFNTIKK